MLMCQPKECAEIAKYAKKLDLEDVKYEMEKSTAKHFPQEHIYLTDKYVVSDVNGLLKVNEYEEFVWIYNFKAQQYGVTVNIFLTVKTKNKKELHIATSTNENKLNEIISIIKQKNTNILVGFTPENKKEYKNICKRKE